MSNAVGRRYAKALFELSKDNKSVDKISANLTELLDHLEASSDFKNFVYSPLYSRDEQRDAIMVVAKKAKMEPLLANTLGLMASKGRLGAIEGMASSFQELVNSENEETVAVVTSAEKLSGAQEKKLAEVLKSKLGKDVAIQTEIDPEILGGLIIQMGSTMIDNSLKGKLSKLHNAMKEVG